MNYLDRVVGSEGVLTHTKKIQDVIELPSPTAVATVRSGLGLVFCKLIYLFQSFLKLPNH